MIGRTAQLDISSHDALIPCGMLPPVLPHAQGGRAGAGGRAPLRPACDAAVTATDAAALVKEPCWRSVADAWPEFEVTPSDVADRHFACTGPGWFLTRSRGYGRTAGRRARPTKSAELRDIGNARAIIVCWDTATDDWPRDVDLAKLPLMRRGSPEDRDVADGRMCRRLGHTIGNSAIPVCVAAAYLRAAPKPTASAEVAEAFPAAAASSSRVRRSRRPRCRRRSSRICTTR